MEITDILAKCDHTLLKPESTTAQIDELCEDAIRFKTASVCIPPCFVAHVKEKYGKDGLKICTVIGFPNGNMTTDAKVFETKDALSKGADEIDMVINIGKLKEKDYAYVTDEIRSIKDVCKDHILKVIIETCQLTDEEKVKMCHIVGKAGADYIKTSTGFGSAGATFEDVKLFADNVPEGIKIKAAGGIASIEDAVRFVQLGADRLGTSRLVAIAKQM
ncbi:MAG: deoxyribose-phosphate aldolase [Lachnospiraceae bacterium]|nr:deoxyribose-phosphate aldolase [Lachnospiraceae bacterium]MBR4175710.1 deoxyribose-phosphate aldolase [Lachnospiraceae bacterium]